MTGPGFLGFWLAGWLVVAVAVVVIRHLLAGARGTEPPEDVGRRLPPTTLAYLVGGARRAIEAAVAGLHHRGLVEFQGTVVHRTDAERARLEVQRGVYRGWADAAETLCAVEREVLAQLPASVAELEHTTATAELEHALEQERLLVDRGAGRRLLLWLVPGGWLALGAMKLLVGMSRGHGVTFLFILLIVAATVTRRLVRLPRLTWVGQRVVAAMRDANHGLELTAQTAPAQLSGTDMTLAYALYGHAAIGIALAALMPSFHAPVAAAKASWLSCSACGTSTAADCSSSSSCGGGGGCGGGCGGCGGCS